MAWTLELEDPVGERNLFLVINDVENGQVDEIRVDGDNLMVGFFLKQTD